MGNFSQIMNVSLLVQKMKNHQDNTGYMTKMAAMTIYGKNTLKIFFPGTAGLILMIFCIRH